MAEPNEEGAETGVSSVVKDHTNATLGRSGQRGRTASYRLSLPLPTYGGSNLQFASIHRCGVNPKSES